MDGVPVILRIVHAIVCARSLQEYEGAFAALCVEDLEAAERMADVLVAALPHSAPVWRAILEQAHRAPEDVDRQSGATLADCDAVDTARDLARRMGWRDMEPST